MFHFVFAIGSHINGVESRKVPVCITKATSPNVVFVNFIAIVV